MDLLKELTARTIRSAPDVWISRVVLFERLTPEPVVIRDIPLSRGLNIVWAEETEEDDPAAEITGHSAGKTTFCRLLRYILGEKTFGTKVSMALIHESFPEGYVAAELQVLGGKWSVRRPFGGGRLSYILADATIEQLLEERGRSVSQDSYTREIGFDSLLDRLETGGIVRTGEPILWGHVLSWCSRDQEARFQSIYEWRSPRSESLAPAFHFRKAEPLFVMRAVLGLFLPSELNGEEKLAELQSQKDVITKDIEEKKREPMFRVNLYEKELRRSLQKMFPEISDLDARPFSSVDLYVEDLARLTSKAIRQIQKNIQELEQKENEQQVILEDLGATIRQYTREKDEYYALYSLNDQASKGIASDLAQRTEQQRKLKQYLNNTCPFGGVLVKECDHVKKRRQRISLTEIHDARALEREKEIREQEARQVKNELARLEELTRQASVGRQRAAQQRDSLRRMCQEKQTELLRLQSDHDQLKYWLEQRDRTGGDEKIDHLKKTLQKIEQSIITTEKELTDLLIQHNKNRDRLTAIFSAAVRSVLLSGTYDGEVRFANRDLDFCITHGQAMTGEAVETLSVLLADVSCLIYNSQSETSHLPGILIHDSPREADLGKRLYFSLLRFVANLHEGFGDDSAPFQYILTTTTSPPKELQSEKYVKLHLNAAKREELLFRCNLLKSQRQLKLWGENDKQ